MPSAPVGDVAPLPPADILERLGRLEQALRYDLGAAEGILQELRAGVHDPALAPTIQELAQKTDMFIIDEALVLIDTLRHTLQPTT